MRSSLNGTPACGGLSRQLCRGPGHVRRRGGPARMGSRQRCARAGPRQGSVDQGQHGHRAGGLRPVALARVAGTGQPVGATCVADWRMLRAGAWLHVFERVPFWLGSVDRSAPVCRSTAQCGDAVSRTHTGLQDARVRPPRYVLSWRGWRSCSCTGDPRSSVSYAQILALGIGLICRRA